jgi:hypothetical protein
MRRSAASPMNRHKIYGHRWCSSYGPWVLRFQAALAVLVFAPGWAGAGHPSSGGQLTRLCSRSSCLTGRSVAALSNHGYVRYENEHANRAVSSRSKVALHLFSCQHQVMARSVHFRVAIQQAQEVRPNPSIERTANGLAPRSSQVHVPLRGANPLAASHVKR